MKKQILKKAMVAIGSIGFLFGVTEFAQATYYNPCPNGTQCTMSDSVDYTNGGESDGVLFNGQEDYKTEIFSIAPPFEPGIDNLLKLVFWVEIADDSNWDTFFDGEEKLKFTTATWELSTGDIDDVVGYDWSQSFTAGDLFADLKTDGTITLTMKWKEGDFYLQGAGIDATVCNNTAPVPEPTTMLLFGAGALGLSGFARRRASIGK